MTFIFKLYFDKFVPLTAIAMLTFAIFSGRWPRQQGRPREQGRLQVVESEHGVQGRRQADSVAEVPERRLSLSVEVICLEEISYYGAHQPKSSSRIFCTFSPSLLVKIALKMKFPYSARH